MKDEKQALVPRLRFPEFRDAEEWVPKKLGDKDISEFVKKRLSLSELSLDTYVSTENILPDFGGIAVASKLPSSGSFTAYKKGDILIANIRPYLKKAWVANRSGGASNDVVVIRPKDRSNNVLLPFLLKNEVFINYVMRGAKGVKMPRGDVALMKEYPLALPGSDEQQRIADCLSSLDALIAAQADKLDALKDHKKGLMQQLFPREGETVPRLRFPEFRKAVEWEEATLGGICEMQAGKFVRASNIKNEYEDGLFPCYGGNGLRGYTKSYTHTGEYSLIGRQGALCGNVTLISDQFHATEHAVVVTPNDGVNTLWLYYVLNYLNLNRFATGQAQPGLSVDNLRNIELRFAPDEDEQQKIGDSLSSLDDLITAQSENIEALKTYKKGLMQQLFTNPEAIGI